MEFNYVPIQPADEPAWRGLCPVGEYRVVEPAQLPNTIPVSLKAKLKNSVVMASGTPTGGAIIVANSNRLDRKDEAIDQSPFAVAVLSQGTAPSGCFIQHGNWERRTVAAPPDFWAAVAASGVERVWLPGDTMPPAAAGRLEDLPKTQRAAFEVSARALKDYGLL